MTAYAVHRTSKADLWGKPMLDVLNREMLTLAAMMLDTKRTFDELVIKYSSSKEKAEKLLAAVVERDWV